jgi:hypothetical protein
VPARAPACAQYASFAIELSWKMLVKEGEKKDDGMKMNAVRCHGEPEPGE